MKDYVKYIKVADAVKILFDDCIRYVFPTTAEPTTEFIKLNNAINLLRLCPSEDVEEVVRCKDCKHWYNDGGDISWCNLTKWVCGGNGFCLYAERKDDE